MLSKIGKKMDDRRAVGLYFHIPFCKKKCSYCHFYVLREQEAWKDALLEGLLLEWATKLPLVKSWKIKTLYFGGGTPSLFGPKRLKTLLDRIRNDLPQQGLFEEVTLEANPEETTLSLMQEYKDAGIDRISLGVQTLDDALLQCLGRTHNAQKALDAIHIISQAGFSNLSIDLMYDLPDQTLDHWRYTLEALKNLPITHLSLYNLTLEPGTLFFRQQKQLSKRIPDEATSLAMYQEAIEQLTAQGLEQYEVSAFARKGKNAKHNTGYWVGRPFLGLGPSAFSYWDHKRYRNIADLRAYCHSLKAGTSPIDFEEQLEPSSRRRELLALQLRLRTGVDLESFEAQHGVLEPTDRKNLSTLEEKGLLEKMGGTYLLTKRGLLLYDTVASDLI